MENDDETGRSNAYLRNIGKADHSIDFDIRFPDQDEFTVGRWPKADVFLTKNDNMISRQHATFKMKMIVDAHSWTIRDDKSLNGVYVNGTKLMPLVEKELNEGDVLQFGVTPGPLPSKYIYEFCLDKQGSCDRLDHTRNFCSSSVTTEKKKRQVEFVNSDGDNFGEEKGDSLLRSQEFQESEEALQLAKQKDQEDLEKELQAKLEAKQKELQAKLEAKQKEFEEELKKERAQLEELIKEKDSKQESLISELSSLKEDYIKQQTNALKEKQTALSDIADLLESELQCSICNELFIKTVSLSCAHSFCEICIDEWVKVKQKAECPICRGIFTSRTRSLVLDNYIDRMVEHLSDDLKVQRSELVESRKQMEMKTKQAMPSTHTYIRHVTLNNNIPRLPNVTVNFDDPSTSSWRMPHSRNRPYPSIPTNNWRMTHSINGQNPVMPQNTGPSIPQNTGPSDVYNANRRRRNRRPPRSNNNIGNRVYNPSATVAISSSTIDCTRTSLLGTAPATAIIVTDAQRGSGTFFNDGSSRAPIVITEDGISMNRNNPISH